MVLIDGKKFACNACVKGHRSSSCAHVDRTLMEIGKKGRPPSQCTHCRELRRISKVHSKCMCGNKPPQKSRRFTVLTNGVASEVFIPSEEEPTFNPCTCSTGGQCCCAAPAHPTIGTRALASEGRLPTTNSNPSPNYNPNISTLTPASGLPAAVTSSHCPSGSTPSTSTCCSRGSDVPSHLPSTSLHLSSLSYQNHLDDIAVSPQMASSTATTEPLEQSITVDDNLNDTISWAGCQSALFAPQTAGTVLCFCGIHCPCPGCLLHDPLGLKFPQNRRVAPCPTSTRVGEGCIAGLDLPTVNGLLNLSPIADRFTGTTPGTEGRSSTGATPSPAAGVQLPSVSETLGLSNGWKYNEERFGMDASALNDGWAASTSNSPRCRPAHDPNKLNLFNPGGACCAGSTQLAGGADKINPKFQLTSIEEPEHSCNTHLVYH